MYRLLGATRQYAWGSRRLLPRFLGRVADGQPQAELWLGAHPGDPARTPDGTTLLDMIDGHPERMLGEGVAERYAGKLPFLMKALAAAEPLSLQVHPTTTQARDGFRRENEAGLDAEAATRNYRDDSRKPELLFAITRFEGMAGFRDVAASAEILRGLHLDWAGQVADQLLDGPPQDAVRAVVAEMLATPRDRVVDMLADLTKTARVAEERSHRHRPPASRRHRDRTAVEREAVRVYAQTAGLAGRYPDDPGVLVTLLLNHVVLKPGEAMLVDAGVVHSYTSGFGVEIMASSDNVVRAGLTSKHVDVAELLEVASFAPIPPPLCEAEEIAAGTVQFSPPVDEFSLVIAQAPTGKLPQRGPRILLVLDGHVEVGTDRDHAVLERGDSVFVGDDEGALQVTGDGRVAVGAVAG